MPKHDYEKLLRQLLREYFIFDKWSGHGLTWKFIEGIHIGDAFSKEQKIEREQANHLETELMSIYNEEVKE